MELEGSSGSLNICEQYLMLTRDDQDSIKEIHYRAEDNILQIGKSAVVSLILIPFIRLTIVSLRISMIPNLVLNLAFSLQHFVRILPTK
jgi:hypothetical protein